MTSGSQPSLPTNRAFVVQFRVSPTGAPSCWEGRVEHVVSGQVARFRAADELLAFMSEPRAAARIDRERRDMSCGAKVSPPGDTSQNTSPP